MPQSVTFFRFNIFSFSIVKRETFKMIFRLYLFCWQYCVLNSNVIECSPVLRRTQIDTVSRYTNEQKLFLLGDTNNYYDDL
jgi:hypothetical protein